MPKLRVYFVHRYDFKIRDLEECINDRIKLLEQKGNTVLDFNLILNDKQDECVGVIKYYEKEEYNPAL